MSCAATKPRANPSSLAAAMKISLSSVSQMIERLVRLGYLKRAEDGDDRRRKTVAATARAAAFLNMLKALRAQEFEAGVATLAPETRRLLIAAVAQALGELEESECARRSA